MALKVIGAGLGRTGTLSLKLALEHLGFGPCYHMLEIMAQGSTRMPQWIGVVRGNPDWDAIFDGFQSTVDYPSCTWWREQADHFPEAKVVAITSMCLTEGSGSSIFKSAGTVSCTGKSHTPTLRSLDRPTAGHETA